jgi:DNA-binding CsgD family transcriptional regulator
MSAKVLSYSMTFQQIADALGLNLEQVYNDYRRGMRKIYLHEKSKALAEMAEYSQQMASERTAWEIQQ